MLFVYYVMILGVMSFLPPLPEWVWAVGFIAPWFIEPVMYKLTGGYWFFATTTRGGAAVNEPE